MGSYPTVVDWDSQYSHDLLVGNTTGNVLIYKSTGTNPDGTPILDDGTMLQADGLDIDVGSRATPIIDDWNEDGKQDLLVGNWDGNISIFLNDGTNAAPDYSSSILLQLGGADFDIGTRAAPRIFDWNNDNIKDLLVGEKEGYVYYLENVGTNAAPVFNEYQQFLLGDGAPLQYAGEDPRSRVALMDWNEDGLTDAIVGGDDGRLELYISVVPEPVSSVLFIAGGVILGLRRFWKK